MQPSPVHVVPGPQVQVAVQVADCVPQLPHDCVCVAPGVHTMSATARHDVPQRPKPAAQSQRPLTHVSFVPHDPVAHVPPQPSGPPHAALWQSGMQPSCDASNVLASVRPASRIPFTSMPTQCPRSSQV